MHYKGCYNKEEHQVPNYDVKCNKCGKEFEAFTSIDDRHDIKCDCGGSTKLTIKPGSRVAIHVWIPYLEENIKHQPVMVESKQHLKKLCKENDCVAHRLD